MFAIYDDTIILIPMQTSCDRRIIKSVFLFLERFHRLYGLKVIAWSKQPGNHYFTFFLDCQRENPGINISTGGTGRVVLTVYQDSVGIPAWSAGDQLEMPGWKSARTTKIFDWLSERLTLGDLMRRNLTDISDWRSHYTVGESESYLLAVQVTGHLIARTGGYLRTCGRFPKNEPFPTWLRAMSPDGSMEYLVTKYVAVSVDGVAWLPSGERIDIWELFTAGQTAKDIADGVHERMTDRLRS